MTSRYQYHSPISIPADAIEAERLASDGHPDVRAARDDIMAAQYALDVAERQWAPSIDLAAEVTRNDNALIRTPQLTNPRRLDSVRALLRITVPLYQAGTASSEIRRARAEYAEANSSCEQALRVVVARAKTA